MKQLLGVVLVLFFMYSTSFSQKEKLYDVDANPNEQFDAAIKAAKNEGKHVMVQIGGNWCPWCYKFHDFYKNDADLDSMIKADYVVINVNYNPKNKHQLFEQLDFPQRFGFPVIVIADANGKRLHTQNSWYLEDGKGSYDREKFKGFLKNWTVKAVNPESYKSEDKSRK
ncbi:MAG: thioredoxin family protein [Bacteroidales bacterium]|nr:thioredoxin family protein [Bacteroidales bacterium]